MNITYIVSSFPKLSEKFILDQIIGLIDRGHEVQIIAAGRSDEVSVHENVTKYKLIEKTIYLSKSIDSLGFEISTKLINCLINTNLIHAHFATLPTEIAFAIAKISNIPFIYTAHAYDIFIDPDIEKLKAMSMVADQIITVSEYNKDYLLKLLGENLSDKLSVIHCGISLEEFKPSKQNRDNENPILLTIGRLIEKKGISIAIEAFSRVCERQPHLKPKYYIIGGGILKETLQAQISALHLEDSVVLLGEQTSQNIYKKFKQADIFVLPSVTATNGDREGIPVVLLEAQAMQIPVISTFHTGIPEGLQDNITGYLVPEKDVTALANKMEALLLNPEKRVKMGLAGHKFITDQFNQTVVLDQLENIFNKTASMLNNLEHRVSSLVTELVNQKNSLIQEKDCFIQNQTTELITIKSKLKVLQEFHDQVLNSIPHKIYRTVLKPIVKLLKKS